MSGASGQCTCSIVFPMSAPPLWFCEILEWSGGRERLLDRQKVSPGEALLQRLAQQIRRMQGRERADLARAGVMGEPASAGLEDAVLGIEQGGRRRPAHA